MSRDVGTYDETKRVIAEIESREAGADSAPPKAVLDTPYTGGRTGSKPSDFTKPSIGTVRKNME